MQDSRCNTYEEGADLVLKQMEENEAAARRKEIDTEANNLSGDNRNDVDLEAPVLEETTGGVDAGADERGVNNVYADKSKDSVDVGKAHSPTVDVPVNKDLVDSGEAYSPIVDVPVNKDPVNGDVASVDVKMPGVEQDVNVASVGGKVADEDVAAASVLGCKSSGIGSDANDNVSNAEELPPENFPPEGLDYGDALEDAGVSSTENVLSEDDEMIVSISSDPLTDEAILTSQDFLSSNPESAGKILSSQDFVTSNPKSSSKLASSDVSRSSNTESVDGANAAKVDAFFFTVTRLRTNHTKRELAMFRNEECDAKIEHVAEAFKLGGMLNSNAADVVLYSLREKYQGTDRWIVLRWVTTKILNGDTGGNVRQWFLKSVSDGIDFLHLPTFDPPLEDRDMKSGEAVGHWCLIVLNLKFRRFECLDSLRTIFPKVNFRSTIPTPRTVACDPFPISMGEVPVTW